MQRTRAAFEETVSGLLSWLGSHKARNGIPFFHQIIGALFEISLDELVLGRLPEKNGESFGKPDQNENEKGRF